MSRSVNKRKSICFIFMPSLYIQVGETSKTGKSVSGNSSTITGNAELNTAAGGNRGSLGVRAGVGGV